MPVRCCTLDFLEGEGRGRAENVYDVYVRERKRIASCGECGNGELRNKTGVVGRKGVVGQGWEWTRSGKLCVVVAAAGKQALLWVR